MATISLKATSRTNSGKGVARKIRSAGNIPAVVYRGGESALSLVIDPNEIELKFQRTGNPNTLVSLDLESGSRLCLVRDVQRHPVTQRIRHIDFYEVQDEQLITVSVPVEPVGSAKGLGLGGKIRIMRRKLNIRCKPADIPATVQVDVTELDVGEFIRSSAITAPANSEFLLRGDFNVLTCVGKAKKTAEEEEEAAAAAAAAAEA